MTFNLTYKPFGEYAILIEWPASISEAILKDIINFKSCIEEKNIKSIVEIKSSYNSLLVSYDCICRNDKNKIEQLQNLYKTHDFKPDIVSNLWKIPVCYDDEFGIDLELISKEKNLDKTEIIKRHSSVVYMVYFIGFLPGFLYLGGLDESLTMPRKSTPRLYVEKGSVAIGGNQTGVYPMVSPGGWHIIGNTPINFFNPSQNQPCFAKPLDKIQFVPVSISEYHTIKLLVDAGVYQIENKELHG